MLVERERMQPTSGTITLHNNDKFSSLLKQDSTSNLMDDRTNHRAKSCPVRNDPLSSRSTGITKHIKSWLSEQSIKVLQEKVDFESSAVKNMYKCLLENENELQKNMNDYLAHVDEMNEHKRRVLNKKWHEQTYLPLSAKIQEEMNCDKFYNFDRRKRALYDNYLSHRNKKGHVFLDVISTDEYDPMSLNADRPGPLKATVPKLQDPLLHLENKRNTEDRSVLACDLGLRPVTTLTDREIERLRLPKLPLVPLGRHGTTCRKWMQMKSLDIQGEERIRSQAKMDGQRRNLSKAPLHEVKDPPKEMEMFDSKKWKKRRQFPNDHNTLDLLR